MQTFECYKLRKFWVFLRVNFNEQEWIRVGINAKVWMVSTKKGLSIFKSNF